MKRSIVTPAELGMLVRATRKARGRRLDEVAATANLGHVFVRHVEHGKETLHLGKVLQLLAELGVNLEVSVPDDVAVELDTLSASGLRPLKSRKAASAVADANAAIA